MGYLGWVKDIILNAENAKQFQALLKEAGRELSLEEAESMFTYLTKGEEVSEDELTAVSGGFGDERDYAADGCAASVEFGSDCWGIDGGCSMVNVRYNHPPRVEKCPACGEQTIYMSHEGYNVFYFSCHSCGAEFIQWPGKKKWDRLR